MSAIMKEPLTELGYVIRRSRLARNLSLNGLAATAGCSKWTIHRIETGKTIKPTRQILDEILAALDRYPVCRET